MPDIAWLTLICPNKQTEMLLRSIPPVDVGRSLYWKLSIVDLLEKTSGIEHRVMFESR